MIYLTRWLKAGSLHTKKVWFYLLWGKPIENGEKCVLFHVQKFFSFLRFFSFFPDLLMMQKNGLIRMLWLRWLLGFRKLKSLKKVEILQFVFVLRVASWKNIIFFIEERSAVFFPYFHYEVIFCYAELFECAFNFQDALLGRRQFLATESPLKMMENAFYFTSNTLFVLKIFKFLSGHFGHLSKRLDRKG